MLEIIIIILVLLAIMLMIYSIGERSNAFCMMDSFLWFFSALFMIQGVEIPYQMFNSTSGNIELGVQIIQTNLEPISYLFAGFGILMFLLFVTFTLELFTDKKIKR